MARRGVRIEHLWIVLSGTVVVTRDTGSGPRPVMEWGPGDVTGRLPYSRMPAASVDIPVDAPVELLGVHERHFLELVTRCPRFTEWTVHTMIDRARAFKTTEVQAEKMISLGRLAAGLAHELNNPASATVRGAAVLRDGLAEAYEATRSLFATGLPETALQALDTVRSACGGGLEGGVRSPLEQADREAEVEDWLADHGCARRHAAPLADTSVSVAQLDELARAVPDGALDACVRWLAATCSTRAVTAEIEGAARRIHELVAAVKGFTYMDNLGAAGPVGVASGLRDTVTMLAARARKKGATIRLDVPGDLPPVRTIGGELNQVWMNLVDNALAAIGDGGSVEIDARADRDRVVVRIVDDGPGIPADVLPQIFEPFFTTKAQGEGTGLGLDIARRLVRRHRGDIEVDSRPGRTEFRVILAVEAGTPTPSVDSDS